MLWVVRIVEAVLCVWYTGIQKQVYIPVQELDRIRIVLMQAEPSCVSRRLLGRLEYTTASTIGLHRGNTAVVALGRSVRCGANLERRRK